MQRELKFRAKTKKGEWLTGMPTYDFEYIFNDRQYDSVDNYEIVKDTVSQFTGLKDKNGNEIFEGDYLRQRTHPCSENKDSEIDYDPLFDRYEIKWDSHKNGWNAFPVTALSSKDYDIAIQQLGGLISWPCEDVLANPFHYEIIGNIYDNPELSQDVS